LQRDILAALEGKALTARALARELRCSSRRVFKPRGLLGLKATDPPLVAKGAHGYYRPDAPPPVVRGRGGM
jgi:hypothetical protein